MSPVENAAFRIASAIPGRIRVQLSGRGTPFQDAADRLARVPGVLDVDPIARSNSLVIRYASRERDLPDILHDVESTVGDVVRQDAPPVTTGNGAQSSARRGRTNGARRPSSAAMLHAIPGRVRLRLPGLRRRPDIAAQLEYDLAVKPGIESVEVQRDSEFVIVRYSPKAYEPGEMVKLVERQYRREMARKLPDNEFHRAADIKPHEPPRINPLLLPTVAFGVAAIEAVPVAVAGGALALAAMPIVARATQGFRRSCLTTEQFDVLTLGLLVSQGNFLAGGMLTWLVALSDLTRRNTREQVRSALSQWKASERRRPGFLTWEDEAAQRVENVPLSNTHTQTGAARTANRFGGPMLGLAVTDYLITRDVSRVIGILKPRCEFETSLQFAAPASVLTAITSAAQNGVLFNGGKAMEKLAEIDTIRFDSPIRRSDEPLRRALADRGIDFERDGEESEDRGGSDRIVARVTNRASESEEPDETYVTVLLARPGDAIDENVEIVLADDDPSRLIYAIDVARDAVAIVRKNTRLLAGAAGINVVATLLGYSPAPLSTLISTGATVTAAMNAVRPPQPRIDSPAGLPPPDERPAG